MQLLSKVNSRHAGLGFNRVVNRFFHSDIELSNVE